MLFSSAKNIKTKKNLVTSCYLTAVPFGTTLESDDLCRVPYKYIRERRRMWGIILPGGGVCAGKKIS